MKTGKGADTPYSLSRENILEQLLRSAYSVKIVDYFICCAQPSISGRRNAIDRLVNLRAQDQ